MLVDYYCTECGKLVHEDGMHDSKGRHYYRGLCPECRDREAKSNGEAFPVLILALAITIIVAVIKGCIL
jgi:hypothetical protein